MRNISDHFRILGAPLANVRTSWGGVNESKKIVYLQIWRGESFVEDGVLVVPVAKPDSVTPERRRHLELIQSGYQGFAIMRHGVNDGSPCKFNERELHPITKLVEQSDGSVLVYLGKVIRI